jgi:hypothetical protein
LKPRRVDVGLQNLDQNILDSLHKLSLEEIVTFLVKDATSGTRFNADAFIKKLAPIPDYSEPDDVLDFLDRFVTEAEKMSLEHVRILARCHSSIVAVLKVVLLAKKNEQRRTS